jgi:predicted GNAT family acetyltransferase
MRGYGHAPRGMSEICNRLLDEHPTLCLYVNDFNTAATALYERLGFARVGEFQSIFL